MSITDKTRKILWGRSGNLCAFCKAKLVVDASEADSEAVVGDECHIISGARNGPRHSPGMQPEFVDGISNLILLCRVHHKLVDDQSETFTTDALRQLKANHERWVHERLEKHESPKPVRIVRERAEIPSHLILITSAKTLLDLSADCHGRYDNYPDDLSDEELDCVGTFLQNLTDWGDLGLNAPYEKVTAQRSLSENMSDLSRLELCVYAAREKQRLEGGVMSPSPFFVLHLAVVRQEDPRQIHLTPGADS